MAAVRAVARTVVGACGIGAAIGGADAIKKGAGNLLDYADKLKSVWDVRVNL